MIVLVAAVAVQFRPGRPPVETTLPQMSPQVMLPRAATPTASQQGGATPVRG